MVLVGSSSIGEMGTMSESVSSSCSLSLPRRAAADREAFAQVEKWLAVIREISREQAKA
jgi:hypothetical protein